MYDLLLQIRSLAKLAVTLRLTVIVISVHMHNDTKLVNLFWGEKKKKEDKRTQYLTNQYVMKLLNRSIQKNGKYPSSSSMI